MSDFEIKIQKISVQNQKMPQFCVGTNVSFEQYSKIQITAVRYNISKILKKTFKGSGDEYYDKFRT